MSADDLERRYRRLLAVYPWEHRRAYEDEMLAVLLAGARPGQRRPSAGDVRDLVGAGLRARLRVGARGFTEPAWADAAAVTGLVAAVVLLALVAADVLTQVVPDPLRGPGAWPGPSLTDWLRVAGWSAVSGAALAGLRWAGAGLAWAAVAAWALLVAPQSTGNPSYVVDTMPQFLLAVVAAAALTVPVRRPARAVLGVRRVLPLLLAPAVAVALVTVNRATRPGLADQAGTYYVQYGLEASSELVLLLYLAGFVLAGAAVLVTLATVAAPVRRRIIVMFLPVAALAVAIDSTLSGWAYSTVQMGHAIPLVPAQWAMLVLLPPATFLAGVLVVRRREETLRMVALGRAADREQPTA
ncbi:hypothetical protein AB0J20_25810 [Micromonospora costi]|uniref:hypothetical protein n=1 Tax=Micromonospora costi TaxID=1530042 RepID=UPI0033C86233